MKSKQINNETTRLLRVDAGWHQAFKERAPKLHRSVKSLVEECFVVAWDQVCGKEKDD